ncbi:MAG: glycosyltransferase family 39 protein [candidate division WOR-3 bacterium]
MRSASRLLPTALAAGIALRLFLLVAPSAPLNLKAVEPIADAAEYLRLADNLVRHRLFSLDSTPPFRPDVFRTPVYPLFLAGFFQLFTNPLLPALLGQLVLSLCLIWATHQLARGLGLDEEFAATAALFVAVTPNLAFLSTKLVTETLFTLGLVLNLLLLDRFRVAGRAHDLIATGVLCGLLILTRPIATFFPLVVAGYLFYRTLRYRMTPIFVPILPLAAATVVVLPWVIRNGRATGRYIISTVSERNVYLYSAASVLASEKSISLAAARDSMMAEVEREFGQLDSSDESHFWGTLSYVGWRHVLRHPITAVRIHIAGSAAALVLPLSIRPLLIHFGAGTNQDFASTPHLAQQVLGLLARARVSTAFVLLWRERLSRMPILALILFIWALVFHLCLLLLFVVGLLSRQGRSVIWLLLPLFYFALSVGPVGDARFRAPVEPLMAIIASVGLATALKPR